ncbi:MAG TPA: outer membrane beta-barrel protein [Chryseolinea sp.]|nr:outer membrane beta-barrel protein [Chryseolinea sp.]
MIKTSVGIILLSVISFVAPCQIKSADKPSIRPDIPGIFTFEFGFNSDLSGPDDFSLGFWGSRTVNIYYQYEFRLFHSPFSIVPGLGLSMERFKFKNEYTMGYEDNSDQVTLIPPAEAVVPSIKKSMLITNFVDVPIEIRYTMKPDDPTRSFKIAVGGRIGYLYDSFSKIKYTENSETRKLKDKQDFNLNRLRYGLTGKLGFGNFMLFGYYNLTPLFEKGRGLKTDNISNDFSTMTFGISLSSF